MKMPINITIDASIETISMHTERAAQVAAMFGLGLDETRRLTILPQFTLAITPGSIVFITGPSGSGKSTILRLVAARLRDHHPAIRIIELDALQEPDNTPLVDAFEAPLETSLDYLARAGLADAGVLLRLPAHLSDGQRFRFNLARVMHLADQSALHADEHATGPRTVILIDEFLASLDRITAAVIARSIRKWISRSPHTLIAATTHDDLVDHLAPDLLIVKDLGCSIRLLEPRTTTAP